VLKSCVSGLALIAESLKLIESVFRRHEHVTAVCLPFLVKTSASQMMRVLADTAGRLTRARKGDPMASLIEVCRQVMTALADLTDVFSAERRMLLMVTASAFLQKVRNFLACIHTAWLASTPPGLHPHRLACIDRLMLL
jgi:hypothetical protein